MKVESIVFVNTIPQVSTEGMNYRIDFGTVVVTLNPQEAASLCVNILSNGRIRKGVFESLGTVEVGNEG